MKKVLSVFLCFIICISPCISFADASLGASVEISAPEEFAAGEFASLLCHITNAPENTPARLELYIDGEYIADASKDISIGAETEEKIEFFVSHSLDRAYLHTALVILKYEGIEKYASHIFSLGASPDISMKFFSVPLSITANHELYYGVEFVVPSGKSYRVKARGIARSLAVEDFKDIIVTNGHREIIYVAPEFVGSGTDYFDFAYEICGNWYDSSMKILKEHKKLSPDKEIKPVVIPATINYTTPCYSSSSLKKRTGSVNALTSVEYLNPDNHESMSAARIKLPSGAICWVPMRAVNISKKNFTIPDTLTDKDKEDFVNSKGYKSDTPYLIWVNKERQRLFVFMGSEGNWHICNSFPVATGLNSTPTPTAVCKYEYKTRWVAEDYICDPVLALFDGYAIHNQPVSHSGYVIDRTMGSPASAGCIRMLIDDVNWLWYYVPVKTTVVLY